MFLPTFASFVKAADERGFDTVPAFDDEGPEQDTIDHVPTTMPVNAKAWPYLERAADYFRPALRRSTWRRAETSRRSGRMDSRTSGARKRFSRYATPNCRMRFRRSSR